MNITEILTALQYNHPLTVGGQKVRNVDVSEVGAIRVTDRNIMLFVTLTNGRQMNILSGDLKVGA